MDLRILRYFLAVADEGNITRASERLHVSQPALSTQLAALEDELGQKLFERGARGIELTEKGVAGDGRDYGCRNCHDTEREATVST